MAGASEDLERHVVPRWRSFESTLGHGELSALRASINQANWSGGLDELLSDWTHHKGISTAADLVCAAFVSGREADAADAARFLQAQDELPYGAKTISALCLQKLGEVRPAIEKPASQSEFDDSTAILDSAQKRMFWVQIHTAREELASYPRNPVLWSNLARLFTSVGCQEKASRAMRIALALAPENRFILRSASRMMLHQGAGRQAHRLLTTAQCLQHDPWVLSAEIATASAVGRNSKYIKHARRMVEAGRFSPHHLSELASALGTLEAAAGNRKSGRLLITQSLEQPTENAVAQAAWLSRNTGIIGPTAIDLSRSAEAEAWQAFCAANWKRGLDGTQRWLVDQPFSSRPAVHGSYIASTILEDYDLAVEFAQFGLLSNPDDFWLYNNLAFALAQKGFIERAAKELSKVDAKCLTPGQLIYELATLGLIEFRSGHPQQGRELYRRSLEIARATKVEKGELALVYLALEELRIGSPHGERLRQEAIQATASLTEPWCQLLVDRLRKYRPVHSTG